MLDGQSPRDPAVTVVVPAWDSYIGPRLTVVLDSIASQEIASRVIVVDNANEPPLALTRNVDVVRSERRLSVGAARNLGIAAADSELVVMWDADDVMLDGALAALTRGIGMSSERVAHALAITDAVTGQRHRWPHPRALALLRHPRLFAVLNCVWSSYPTTGATVMRVDAVRACGGYSDCDSGDDWALGAALLLRGRAGWDDQPGRIYADTPGSIWTRHSSVRHILRHCRLVRRRIARDPGAPALLRRLAPLLAPAQWAVLFCVALPTRAQRRVRAALGRFSASSRGR